MELGKTSGKVSPAGHVDVVVEPGSPGATVG